MSQNNILDIFESKNIQILGNIKFKSQNEEIDFLNKFDTLKKEGLNIDFLNQDLINIFSEIELNEENLSKLKRTNWDDFHIVFKNHKDKRALKIYLNFIRFLKAELGVLHDEKPLTDTSLTPQKERKEESYPIDLSIFKPKENFNYNLDKLEKAKKFKIDILFDYVEPSKKITVSDFTLYFNRRLQYFTELLKNRIQSENIVRIDKLKDLYGSNSQVTVIGLISDISQTKNGHYMISIEDKSGTIKCFTNKEKTDMIKQIQRFCLDEGIGVKGKVGNEIIWVDEFIVPSPPNSVELKKTEKEEYVVFISDLHFGAKVFVDDAFSRFVDFINSQTKSKKLNEIAKKVKYIIVAGDVIEGIGIYPNQGMDARILSTELQYHEAARWFSQIPKDKCLIIIPGNHDTDRLSEPQPKIAYEKAYALYNMPNVLMLSNPAIIKLFQDDPSGGLDFFLYHGGSIFYYADKIRELREKGGAKVPEEVVAYLLEKRHLAPSHGSTLYIPDNQRDPLVIRKMPDFFVVGHTHKLAIKNYKGCSIISCGCWVEMSDYQEKMGMYPDIGKCVLVNTKNRRPQILNFYTGDGKVVRREKTSEEI